ncbi:acyltransferase family protein [Luteolibacter sp. LG18]|uniref:acyltransferase n=1 Tax=Luteolibacter sp. LG18 TaxID=2819286 RepID=UPI002B2D40F3|nr:acyltransferase [Luteolibacter sp. LG18]
MSFVPFPAPAARISWLDTVRVLACFLVVVCHSTDAFVQTPDGSIDGTAALFVSGVRACVPLFVMISGALLLPMRGSAEEFFKRRFSRVIVPFLIWGVVLALLPLPKGESEWAPVNAFEARVHDLPHSAPGKILYNIGMLPINFTNSNIHFWFLYIILGLYLFVPVISPWVRQASIKGLCAFLGVWVVTLCLPYLQHVPGHEWFPALHGECDWNSRGMTYYFGGYLGYLVLGHLLTRLPALSPGKAVPLAVGMFALGWTITHQGFLWTVLHQTKSKDLEFFIEFLSPNVALMTAGLFILCRAFPLSGAAGAAMTKLASMSFGIFLIHYWMLLWMRDWALVKVLPQLGAGPAILLVATTTFAASWVVAKLVSRLPGKRWLLG